MNYIAQNSSIQIDNDFPGGNIIIDSDTADTINLHQDLRDTEGNWFYWYFRVKNASGRTLRFQFTQGDAMGVCGPAISSDEGKTWHWLGKQGLGKNSFTYSFTEQEQSVRFCFSIPYVESNLRMFLSNHKDNRFLTEDILCTTPKNRPVEKLFINGEKPARSRIIITARHHCCEMTANYVMEGIIENVLRELENPDSPFHMVAFMFVPFVDKDGVEDGDQGKSRRPHDHNRDYDALIYSSVKAITEQVPAWADDKLHLALDLHCPYLNSREIHGVGSEDQGMWAEQCKFFSMLESLNDSDLKYFTKDNVPFGVSWNVNSSYAQGKSFKTWALGLPSMHLASTLEIPYAQAYGVDVTPERARRFGHQLTNTIQHYLLQTTLLQG